MFDTTSVLEQCETREAEKGPARLHADDRISSFPHTVSFARLERGVCMNHSCPEDLMTASDDFPRAIPRLIGAAVASFDADRDTSRRYLHRALALLHAKRGAPVVESAGRSDRGGLLVWQLNGVIDYIETHLSDKITAGDLADLVNLSKGQLSRAFKISVGVAPFQYIVRRRLELACAIMRTTREPLSQVAIACGLCDQAHFSRMFRNGIGMSPSAWRRAMLARDTANFRIIDVGSIGVDQRDSALMTHSGPR